MAYAAEYIFGNVASSRDPDMMMLDEVMKQLDHAKFFKVMHKEINDHICQKH